MQHAFRILQRAEKCNVMAHLVGKEHYTPICDGDKGQCSAGQDRVTRHGRKGQSGSKSHFTNILPSQLELQLCHTANR